MSHRGYSRQDYEQRICIVCRSPEPIEEGKGLKWIQAEHRIRPELLVAQTGLMQGAAGVGLFLLRLDAAENGRDSFVRMPDTPFER